MTQDGGQRVAIADGAMLADPSILGNAEPGVASSGSADEIFQPEFWAARGALQGTKRGRGAAWFVGTGGQQWVLRHYRRGGFISRLATDRYVWRGEGRVRAFAEWRLLAVLWQRGLPVPQPMGARYQRHGLTYRCDLITRRIPDALPLTEWLIAEPLREPTWQAVGNAIARLHAAGADHADLNAHNILVDRADAVSVIDFDRGRLRLPPSRRRAAWATGNLERLKRSLAKITRELPSDRFSAREWQWLHEGYSNAPPL